MEIDDEYRNYDGNGCVHNVPIININCGGTVISGIISFFPTMDTPMLCLYAGCISNHMVEILLTSHTQVDKLRAMFNPCPNYTGRRYYPTDGQLDAISHSIEYMMSDSSFVVEFERTLKTIVLREF
jgi:hypothetical protein